MKQAKTQATVLTPQFEAKYVRPKPGRTLIVGSYVTEGKVDRRTLYADALGVDMREGPGVDIVQDMEEVDNRHDLGLDHLFDHVDCLSVLEHCKRPWLVAASIQRLMAPGATIFVSVPFVWRPHNYPVDFWRMTCEAVAFIFDEVKWEQLMYSNHRLSPTMNGMGGKDEHGHTTLPRTETVGFGTLV